MICVMRDKKNGTGGRMMDIASMIDLVDMIKHLNKEDVRISDLVFTSDGKSIAVDLTNGESYRFSVR